MNYVRIFYLSPEKSCIEVKREYVENRRKFMTQCAGLFRLGFKLNESNNLMFKYYNTKEYAKERLDDDVLAVKDLLGETKITRFRAI